MSAFARPIVVHQDKSTTLLERMPLGAGSEGLFSEEWLQKALFQSPEALPLWELDPTISEPLLPVCMELETGAGPADILYVTTNGRPVLVETKLWRNAEARRTVVAQILDYAKQLTEWSFDDLAREAGRASGKGPGHLLGLVKQSGQDVNESEFVDGINRNLRSGNVLLIIVGDGIRSDAESLVGFLERYGNLRFRLGLLEVAAYRLPNEEVLLQPRILAKTEILERTVLLGPSGPMEFDQVASAEDATERSNPQTGWFQSFWTDYLRVLRLDDPNQPKPTKPAKSTNIFLPLPPSGGSAWISAYIAQSAGKGGVYLTFSKTFDRAREYYDKLLAQREDIEEQVGTALSWERQGDKAFIAVPNIPLGDINVAGDRDRVIKALADSTNRLVNVFRHRLESFGRT